ncbi:hypothetical protein DJ568_03425 [Mucilaginibacter hurinus]|uniref:Uncharacterized protein n=2 Tax=Mucilaginibacter hurinus TaxID=2201324 RepID=A0A367GRD3_9SPHI|nr:hypothetical protein DJ568_03425 [Mucilaginibacter hurinus]
MACFKLILTGLNYLGGVAGVGVTGVGLVDEGAGTTGLVVVLGTADGEACVGDGFAGFGVTAGLVAGGLTTGAVVPGATTLGLVAGAVGLAGFTGFVVGAGVTVVGATVPGTVLFDRDGFCLPGTVSVFKISLLFKAMCFSADVA